MSRSLLARAPRRVALLVTLALALTALPVLSGAVASAADDVVFDRTGSIESCNGITSTPGSANTMKNIVAGDFQPGGTVRFEVTFPVSPLASGDFFELADCFVSQDSRGRIDRVLDAFTIRFTPNDKDFAFDYALQIPDDLPLGTEVCNYVKTTQAPSASPGSNRRGGVCFTVGGTLRIEKRDAADPTQLVGGAGFTVACTPTAAFPDVVISGLESARPSGAPVVQASAGGVVSASGFANAGVIAVNGPEGTPCTVTETSPPPGYLDPTEPVRTFVIPRTGTGTPQVVLNTRLVTTAIATQATPQVVTGGTITDTATLTPSTAPGSVVFTAYGPDDETCSGTPSYTSPAVPVVDGEAAAPGFAPAAVGTYRWIAAFTSTSAGFTSVSGACNDENESSVVLTTTPTIATTATPSARLMAAGDGALIRDSATVTGLTGDAGGTVTFRVFGPDDATCAGTAAFTSVRPLGAVSGTGTADVDSDAFAPQRAGTYRWTADYSGDARNGSAAGPCNAPNETSVVERAQTTLTTVARATASLPDDAVLTDTATLSGTTPGATGDIVFKLYGPDPTPGTPTCVDGQDGNLVHTSAGVAVSGPGVYVSTPAYTATRSGTYFWVAHYSGDDDNAAVSGECGEVSETSVVGKATPELRTTASGAQLPGTTTISDTAVLSGLNPGAGGTVTFTAHGPLPLGASPVCETVFATHTVALPAGAGGTVSLSSGPVAVARAGDYLWVADYSGDDDNAAVTGGCGDEGETSTVNPTSPILVTTATDGALPAGTVSDRAQLTGVTATARGTLTFQLYGPSAEPDCSGEPVFTSDALAVEGPRGGEQAYGPVTTTVAAAGSYYWRAFYSGDPENRPVAGECGETGETSVVAPAQPALTTRASAVDGDDRLPGVRIQDTATLTGLTDGASGSVTFEVFSDAECAVRFATTGPVAVLAAGGTATAVSDEVTVLDAGTYYWIARYSGDANNLPAAGECGDPGEDVTVAKAQPSLVTRAALATLPDAGITDTATLTGLTPSAGGTVTFLAYGLGDVDCEDEPAFTSAVALPAVGEDGEVAVTSGAFAVSRAGSYQWVAAYGGDASNEPVAGECGDDGETSTVLRAAPALTTQASSTALAPLPQATPVAPSSTVTDTATLTGLNPGATGTVGFAVWGPQAPGEVPDCTGTPAAVFTGVPLTLTDDDGGSATATSPALTVTASGAYHWIASYSGDADNAPVSGACGDEGETSTVVQPVPGLAKTADRPEGSTVAAGDRITYTVQASNAGTGPLAPAVVVDALPAADVFTLDPASVSSGGVVDAVTGTITWLEPSLGAGESVTYTYAGTVGPVDAATEVVNVASFEDLRRQTLHVARPGGLSISKAVVTGEVVNPGSTLTYTMTVAAAGELVEPDAVVRDVVPGADPQHPGSGATTYVPGSASCGGEGACEITYEAGTGTLTWALGDLVPGTPRTVSFDVTVDVPVDPATPVEDVVNVASVLSARTPATPSNQVVTRVTLVLGAPVPPGTTPPGTTPPGTTPPGATPPGTTPPGTTPTGTTPPGTTPPRTTPSGTTPPAVTLAAAPPPAVTPAAVRTAVAPRALPFTGSWVLPLLVLGSATLVLGASLAVLGSRRRPRRV